ncbi:MAG: hypothetical protein MUC63_02425 [Planctomycetes bacterium]|nr:hypothetical protein [Planctomycetota bacterium]
MSGRAESRARRSGARVAARIAAFWIGAAACLAGCGAPRPADGGRGPDYAAQADLAKNFVLEISNRSEVRDPVEIQVFLDGAELLRDRFPFAGRSPGGRGLELKFEIARGRHTVRFRVPELDEAAEREFEIREGARATASFAFFYSVSQDEKKNPVVKKQLDLQLRED